MITKGQNLRISLNGTYIAYATACTVHTSASLEDQSTKDSTSGLWTENTPMSLSWDISCEALVAADNADLFSLIGQNVEVSFDYTSGEQNRVKGTTVASGTACVNDVSVNATNRQNVTWSLQAQGVGKLNGAGGDTPSSSNI